MKYTCYKHFQEWSLEDLELDMEFLIVFLCSAIAVIGPEQLTSKTRLPWYIQKNISKHFLIFLHWFYASVFDYFIFFFMPANTL